MSVPDLHAAYLAAKNAWIAAGNPSGLECDGPAWEAFIAAELALIQSPCLTIDDVRAKASIILSDDSLFDTLTSNYVGEDRCAAIFLRSMTGQGGAS